MTTTTQTTPTQAQWDATNTFLGELFVNSTLSQDYLDICQQANGQNNAPKMLNNWLQQQGYDTTPELVYAALIALQNTSLSYWSGVYGQSFFQDSQGHTSAAPVLAIIPDAEGNAIPYLNGIALQNYTFKSVDSENFIRPTLTWGFDSNSSTGNITFYYTSPITPESSPPPTGYTGNWFQGTLQTSATTSPKTYYAGLGEPNASKATPLQTQANFTYDPTNTSFWSGDNWQIILAYIGGILAVIGLGLFIYVKIKVSTKQIDELQIEENTKFEVLDKKKSIKWREIQVEVQKDGTMITYEYLPDGTTITNPPVIRTLVVTEPEGFYMEERLFENGKIGEFIALIGDYKAYIQPNPPENIRNNLNYLDQEEDPQNPRTTLEKKEDSNFQDALPSSQNQAQPQKIDKKSAPPAPKNLSEHQPQQSQPQQQKVISSQNNAPTYTAKEKTAVQSQKDSSTDNEKSDQSENPTGENQFKFKVEESE